MPTPITVNLAQLDSQPLRWLWPGRIPLGKLTLLLGDPGQGKSLLALEIASRVTRGSLWPQPHQTDPQQPARRRSRAPKGSVVILSTEDHAADTLLPRLKAAKARLDRCSILQAVRTDAGHARPLSLDRDVDMLARTIEQTPDCRLVIIDPLTAYLGSSDANHNSAICRLLGPLVDLAARTGAAFVLINHLNKRRAAAAIQRSLGATALVALARAAWLVQRDPQHPEHRALVSLKNNLVDGTSGLRFEIQSATRRRVARIAWLAEAVELSADQLLAPPTRPRPAAQKLAALNLAEQKLAASEALAENWLRQSLQQGPQSGWLLSTTCESIGIARPQLFRAFQKLAVIQGTDGWSWDSCTWTLPAPDHNPNPAPAAST